MTEKLSIISNEKTSENSNLKRVLAILGLSVGLLLTLKFMPANASMVDINFKIADRETSLVVKKEARDEQPGDCFRKGKCKD